MYFAVKRRILQWIDVIGSGKTNFAEELCNWQWKDVIGSGKMHLAVERCIWQ
jgi:hypothetical protein